MVQKFRDWKSKAVNNKIKDLTHDNRTEVIYLLKDLQNPNNRSVEKM